MTSVKVRHPTSASGLSSPGWLSRGSGAGQSAGPIRSGAIVGGLSLAAILAGYLIAHGQWKVVAALLVPIPVLLIVRAAPIAALLVLVVMNGIPIVNLEGRAAGARLEDLAVVALAILLFACRDRRPSAAAARYRRVARVWSGLFIAFWAFTVARSVLLESIPLRDAFVYGRDFLYFAVLLPLAFNARFSARSLRIAGLILLGAGSIYAFGQVVAGVTGRTLVGLVHPVKVGNIVGSSRFYSPMNYVVETCLMFAAGLYFAQKSSRHRTILGVTVAILAGGAVLGLTRANYFGIVIAVVACAVVYVRRHGSLTGVLLRVTVAILLVVAALVLVTAIAGHGGSLSSNPVVSRVQGGVSDISQSTGTFGYRRTLDSNMLNVLGSQWPIGLGFLYAPVHPIVGLPDGAIRNTDTGVLNIIMTMGLLGTIFMYAPFVYLIRELLRVSRRSSPNADALPRWILYGGTAWFAWAIASSLTLVLLFSVPGVVLAAVVLAALARSFAHVMEVPVVGDGVELAGSGAALTAPTPASLPSSFRTGAGATARVSNGLGASPRASNGIGGAPPVSNGADAALPSPNRTRTRTRTRTPRSIETAATLEAVATPAPPPVTALEPLVAVERTPPSFEASGVGTYLSVVILTYDSSSGLRRCIKALRAVLGGCEIIVVENLPGDRTVSAVQAADDRVQVISMGARAGYGAGCNRGVQAASSEHVLVMTQDLVVEEADLSRLAASFDQAEFGLISLAVRREGEESAHAQPFGRSDWSTELKALSFAALGHGRSGDKPSAERLGSAAWPSGVLILVRRTEFATVGGFDDRFFLYYEHDALGERYRQAGLPIGAADTVTAHHTGGGADAEEPPIDPMARYLFGWLEFVTVEYGPQRARQSWLAIRSAHRAGRRFSELGGAVGVRRLGRNAQHLRSIDADLVRLCTPALAARHESCSVVCQVVKGGAKQ